MQRDHTADAIAPARTTEARNAPSSEAAYGYGVGTVPDPWTATRTDGPGPLGHRRAAGKALPEEAQR
ncbi:hypothetical protein [Streptomyces sp. NPDC002845]